MGDLRDAYTVSQARYSKGNLIVRYTHEKGAWKGRPARLLEALNFRYTGRENGYVGSPGKVKRFEKMMTDGWDASYSGKLESPEDKAHEPEHVRERLAQVREESAAERALARGALVLPPGTWEG